MPLVGTPMSVTLMLKTRTLAVSSQTVNLLPQLVIIMLVMAMVMVRVLAMVRVIVNMIMVIVTTVAFVIFFHHLVFSSVPSQ